MAAKKAKHSALGRGLGALIPTQPLDDEEPVSSREKTGKTTGEPSSVKTAKTGTRNRKNKEAVPDEAAETVEKTGKPAENGEIMVPISMVEPNKNQPRKTFDEDSLRELADSIKNVGVIQPLIVQKNGDFYEIIAGERRWRAARMAGLKTVPVLVREYTDRNRMEIALIENIQREDLNPIEEANGYEQLIREYNLKQDEVAQRVSKSRVAITNSLRLLKLDPRVQEFVSDGTLSGGHARALLGLESKDEQYEAALQVIEKKLSVRETERLVKNMQTPRPEKKKNTAREAYFRQYEDTLGEALGSKIHIRESGENKGKIEISFFSQEDFERICQVLTQEGKKSL
ncbi:MAG: ParB/RepB/Spo0J family partition protein [Lachnospiraceae bacterium]|jgi:ParB family chromosome partitioning protein